eukprot:2881991-Pyramimonas_sp.AAC.1
MAIGSCSTFISGAGSCPGRCFLKYAAHFPVWRSGGRAILLTTSRVDTCFCGAVRQDAHCLGIKRAAGAQNQEHVRQEVTRPLARH